MQGKKKKKESKPHGGHNNSRSSKASEQWYAKWVPLLVIIPLVFLTYSPILDNELTNWDDPDLIIDNPLIRELSIDNLKTIFTEFYFGNYQPLHLVSYSVEYHFWQLNPAGYHAVSLLLFLCITALVYYFVFLISKRNVTVAVIATLLFALNGMRVESVAWASERKDMLYAMFYMAALVMYVKFITSSGMSKPVRIKYFTLTFFFFVLSVFSKVMAVSLVGALVFLDYLYQRRLTLWLLLEKIPFVALSIVLGLVQIEATASTHTFDTSGNFDLVDRLLIVSRNLMFYVYKMLLPVNLSAFHPYPPRLPDAPWPLEFYLAPVFVLILAIVFFWSLRNARIIAFSVGFFVSGVALVLQFVAIGPAMFNERYSLIPAIALSFLIAWYTVHLAGKFPAWRNYLYGGIGIYLIVMLVITYNRCNIWQDSLTLWDDVLEQYPAASMALNNRGRIYGSELGNTTKAFEDLSRAIASDPGFEQPYSNRGIIFCMNGEYVKGIADFTRAIRLNEKYYEPILNRAITYSRIGKYDSALADFTRCIDLKPDRADNYLNRGFCNYQTGQFDSAVADYTLGLLLDPRHGELYLRRSYAMFALERYQEAFSDLRIAQSAGIKPDKSWIEQVTMKIKNQ